MPLETKLGHMIGRRRSIRRYERDPIIRTSTKRLLLAATRAPSAHNRQPWRFAVLEAPAQKEKLALAMGRRLRADRTADGDDLQTIELDVQRSYARITEAPVIIVVCVDMHPMDEYPDERRQRAEFLMAVQSTAMAAQNLLLAAEQEGLGACVMCAPLFCPEIVGEVLSLPQAWQPQMVITIGRPGDTGKDRPRRPLDDVVIWLTDQPAR
jgi:F420 biosynthesis protein FbiB-like protein